jgi:Spy/CpxP family protein refolding chaperone
MLITPLAFAQGRQGPERIKALKTAHITESLDLTAAEAQLFWPVYNKYQDQLEDLRVKERIELMALRKGGLDEMDSAQANQLLDKFVGFRTQEVELKKQQLEALRKVMEPVKILKLQKAEEDFKRMLLNRYRGKRGDH